MVARRNYTEEYGKAEKAYLEGNFEQAAGIIDSMAEEFPEDPSVLLLRGHIYCFGLNDYELAKEQYDSVLEITDQPELINYANKALDNIRQLQEESQSFNWGNTDDDTNAYMGNNDLKKAYEWSSKSDSFNEEPESTFDWSNNFEFSEIDWENTDMEDENIEDPTLQQKSPLNNGFANFSQNKPPEKSQNSSFSKSFNNPFEDDDDVNDDKISTSWQEMPETESSKFPFLEENDQEDDFELSNFQQESDAPTFVVSSQLQEMLSINDEDIFAESMSMNPDDYSSQLSPVENIDNNYSRKKTTSEPNSKIKAREQALDDFELFADEESRNNSELDLEDVARQFEDSDLFDERSEDLSVNFDSATVSTGIVRENLKISDTDSSNQGKSRNNVDRTIVPEVNTGILTPFHNASLVKKQLMMAGAAGIISAIALFGLSFTINHDNSKKESPLATNALIGLLGGACTVATTLIIGQISSRHIKRCTDNLQSQFLLVAKGNFNAKAIVYSQDEFGQLATEFNQMARVVYTTTTEAQRRAEERERITEDLQRQVIRLLDDVEGAARGDLTVRAEVTADVLGAVADAFNLTIENLREIVLQVKQAAQQVHQGATDSEAFARNQSSDALRMAEELAVTLNSVQMLTDSIQRVADSAREAEAVARSSSATAARGGKAVERTVEGILQIRETVSETNRKVKRLAEASQEISKIVASISNISSDINMQALNASIYAVKAGEAGRGFAIVADEVRQLAERSAKSLKDIEQIVLQIQSETGSVMIAMEEGLQQVLDVTERAEQAKGSLEDIIQVSNRIDALVRSITADTVEQRENSRAVAQVMQSVELTAQETSQESQRVGGSLQNLVGIARDLLASVERFRVDQTLDKQK